MRTSSSLAFVAALAIAIPATTPAEAGILKWILAAAAGGCSVSAPCVAKVAGMKAAAAPTLATKCAANPSCAAFAQKVAAMPPTTSTNSALGFVNPGTTGVAPYAARPYVGQTYSAQTYGSPLDAIAAAHY